MNTPIIEPISTTKVAQALNQPTMENDNVFQRMQRSNEDRLPQEIEQFLVHQAGTFSIFSRVVELYGPNALDIASRYICGHTDCHSAGPQGDLDEEVPFWRVKP